MLRIDLAPLPEGVHHITLNPDAEAVGLDPEQFADLQVDVTLDLFNERVLVRLHARATATLECDRTLVRFQQPVEETYRVLFAPPSFVHRDEEAAEQEEVRMLQAADRTIDLADLVRDTLLLVVPARKVAPGAEDVEIPTVFGAPAVGPAVDPRWEALRQLRADEGAQDSLTP